jgi:uncharacterized protein (TIGR02271 family)
MAQTIVGMFDDYDEAQAAVHDLMTAGFTQSDISIVANNATNRFTKDAPGAGTPTSSGPNGHGMVAGAATGAGEGAIIGGFTGLAASLVTMLIPGIGPIFAVGALAATLGGAGLGAVGGGVIGGLTGLGIPKEDAGYYAEGIRRGSTLVTVRADEPRAEEAADILNRHNPVNIDERGGYYRSTGFSGYNKSAPAYTPEQIEGERRHYATQPAPKTAANALPQTNRTVGANESVTVPIVEEQLQVGKREVSGGGARIHTHVIETPVHETVSLHEEHVTVDRHAVNRPASDADLQNALQERTYEITETSEEAVVAKQARVVEEVVVGKHATNRTQTINDTVRRTDVDVEELNEDDGVSDNATLRRDTAVGGSRV